jgi:hypothetical protein
VPDLVWPPLTNATAKLDQLRASAIDTDLGYWLGQLRWPGGPIEAECPHTDARHLTRSEAVRCARQHLNALLRGESDGRPDWRPGPEDKPIPAPFPVGTCLEYFGLGTLTLETGEWVQPGDVGVVVAVNPPGAAGTATDYPEDGGSVLRFHNSPSAEDVIYRRYAEPAWRTIYRPVECP